MARVLGRAALPIGAGHAATGGVADSTRSAGCACRFRVRHRAHLGAGRAGDASVRTRIVGLAGRTRPARKALARAADEVRATTHSIVEQASVIDAAGYAARAVEVAATTGIGGGDAGGSVRARDTLALRADVAVAASRAIRLILAGDALRHPVRARDGTLLARVVGLANLALRASHAHATAADAVVSAGRAVLYRGPLVDAHLAGRARRQALVAAVGWRARQAVATGDADATTADQPISTAGALERVARLEADDGARVARDGATATGVARNRTGSPCIARDALTRGVTNATVAAARPGTDG
jgi:hypothetical protein